ncbi:MAG TPA: DUF3017 domain-containing protein [Streptosporangiaceae bacterium]
MSPGVLAGSGRHGARRRGARKPGRDQAATAGAGEPQAGRRAQWAYLAVLVGVAIALLIIGEGVHLVRSGTLVFAGVLLVAAVARLVLPERLAGMLSSRRRLLDVAIFGVLGIGLLVAGLVVPVPG